MGEVVREGDTVLLHMADEVAFFCVVETFGTFSIKKRKHSTAALIGVPFGSVMEVAGDGRLVLVESGDLLERIDFSAGSGLDNRHTERELSRKTQTMTHEEIAALKGSGASGADVVAALISNSTSFAKKTVFAQEKYIKKKQMRHLVRFRIEKPTAVSICDTLGLRNPDRFCGLRGDGLAQLLAAADVRSGGRALVFDDTAGVVVGAVIERMGGRGTVFVPLPDKLTGPVWLHLHKFNLGHLLKDASSSASSASSAAAAASSSSSSSSSGSSSSASSSSSADASEAAAAAPDAASDAAPAATATAVSAATAGAARALRLVCVSYSQLSRWGTRVITPGTPAEAAAELEEVAAQEDAKIRRTFKAGSVPVGAGAAALAAAAGAGSSVSSAPAAGSASSSSASAPAPAAGGGGKGGSWKAAAFAAKKRRMLAAHEATMAAKAEADNAANTPGLTAAGAAAAGSEASAAAAAAPAAAEPAAGMAEDKAEDAPDAAADAADADADAGSGTDAAGVKDGSTSDSDDDGNGNMPDAEADADADADGAGAGEEATATGGAGASSRIATGSGGGGAAGGAGSGKRRARASEMHLLSHTKLPPLPKRLLLQEGVSSIVIVSEGHPSPLALAAVRFAAPSTPFAIFCRDLHPLAETLRQLRALGVGANMTLSETFLRPQQVLPMRTHPEMVFHGASGYILRGTVPLHPYSAVLPPAPEVVAAAAAAARYGAGAGRAPAVAAGGGK